MKGKKKRMRSVPYKATIQASCAALKVVIAFIQIIHTPNSLAPCEQGRTA